MPLPILLASPSLPCQWRLSSSAVFFPFDLTLPSSNQEEIIRELSRAAAFHEKSFRIGFAFTGFLCGVLALFSLVFRHERHIHPDESIDAWVGPLTVLSACSLWLQSVGMYTSSTSSLERQGIGEP